MRLVVHRGAIVHMMSPGGSVGNGARRAAGKIRDRAKDKVTVDTGLLKNSIVAELAVQGLYSVTWRIGTNVKYGYYQEVGVGPIFARRAPYLVFKVGGKWVKTYSTRGVPAVRYLTNAIRETSAKDFVGGSIGIVT